MRCDVGVLSILSIILLLFIVLLLMMRVKIFSKAFWPRKEVLNQHVHTLYGLVGTYAVAYISGGFPYSAFTGLFAGMLLEFLQYFVRGGALHIEDRIRDVFFWTFGGMIGYVFYILK